MKKLVSLEHFKFDIQNYTDLNLISSVYTLVVYSDGTREWHRGWSSFENLSKIIAAGDEKKSLESEYSKLIKKQQETHNLIRQQVSNANNESNQSMLSTTLFPELKGKLYAKVLIKPIEDKTFEFNGETHARDMMYEYKHGEHVVPDVIYKQIAEVLNQKGIDEIVIKRFHYNNEQAM